MIKHLINKPMNRTIMTTPQYVPSHLVIDVISCQNYILESSPSDMILLLEVCDMFRDFSTMHTSSLYLPINSLELRNLKKMLPLKAISITKHILLMSEDDVIFLYSMVQSLINHSCYEYLMIYDAIHHYEEEPTDYNMLIKRADNKSLCKKFINRYQTKMSAFYDVIINPTPSSVCNM